ncbi:MAG: esterase-like activity of phytase family protein [Vicinamibacterales bacterium]
MSIVTLLVGWRPSSISPILALVAALAAGAACAPVLPATVGRAGDPPEVRLLGASAIWAGTWPPLDGVRVGSLSALAYDSASRRWMAASDDIVRPRLLWFDVSGSPSLDPMPVGVTFITAGPGAPPDALTALDMEGLAVLGDGSLAVSHEGHVDRRGVARQPQVLFATREGVVTGGVRPRERFTIDPADRTHGVRHNLGLESLTRTPDGRLLSGLEQPLAQDGPVSSAARGGVVRLVEFVPGPPAWRPGREWAYQLEPTPSVAGYGPACEDGENGLSDLLALTDSTLLALERACLLASDGAPAYNPVRLFEVTLDGADDVSGLDSLAGAAPVLARKRLVVDLAQWRSRLPPALATLSNFEGMAFGPPGPAGETTVMLVSDDNFRPTQTTAFLWLALAGPAGPRGVTPAGGSRRPGPWRSAWAWPGPPRDTAAAAR